MENDFFTIEDGFPENTILECLEGNGNVIRMVYVTGTDWAPLWYYAEGPQQGQMTRWPVGWRHVEGEPE
jgi:hypothetical protein